MKAQIRPEKETDFQRVYAINKDAFGQDDEARLVNALRNNNGAFIPELSLVATVKDDVVGYILFTKISINNPEQTRFPSLALAPVAVTPALQKQGIGGQLIRHGLRRAAELGYESVIVLGHKEYYPMFGFAPASKWYIYPPFAVPDEVFMAIELKQGALQFITGTVTYPPEFDTV